MLIRPKKELVLSLVKQMAPQYLEFFRDMQKASGWREMNGSGSTTIPKSDCCRARLSVTDGLSGKRLFA